MNTGDQPRTQDVRLQNVREHFNARARRYDNPVTAFIGERELRQIRALVPPGSAVLDYGCGTGRTALDHLRRGCRVTAYDLAPEMVAVAQDKARRLGLTGEFTADPTVLAQRSWPIVTCIGVLDYYPDPVPLLRQLREYVLPGGSLIVTYPNQLSPLGRIYGVLSRFTCQAIPRSPRFAFWAATEADLRVTHLRYAFPARPSLALTLVLRLTRVRRATPQNGRLIYVAPGGDQPTR